MEKVIECYYSLSSPWAYFGGPHFVEVAKKHGARIVLRPYDFLKVVPQTGGIPLRTRPQPRQDYHALELDRWRKFLKMPLNLKPKFYPTDNKPAGWMVIAAQQRGLDAQPLSHAILKALWAEEQDISLPATRIRLANSLGMPGEELQRAESTEAVQREYAQNTEQALKKGVFGAPSYIWNDTVYWGQDRLDFLDRDIAEKG
jgi:2-hydroxychromene-2-carboxylate isomerase